MYRSLPALVISEYNGKRVRDRGEEEDVEKNETCSTFSSKQQGIKYPFSSIEYLHSVSMCVYGYANE